jgi:hypothetical protein
VYTEEEMKKMQKNNESKPTEQGDLIHSQT